MIERKKNKSFGSVIYSTGNYKTNYAPVLFDASPIKTYSGGGQSISNSSTGVFNAYANYYNASFIDSSAEISFQCLAVVDLNVGIDDTRLSLGFENGDTVYSIGLGVSFKSLKAKIGWDTCQSIDNVNLMNEGGIAIDGWAVASAIALFCGIPTLASNGAPA